MHWFIRGVGTIALAVVLTAPAGAAKEKNKKSKKDKGADLREVFPIPIGHSGEGLRIPSVENGKLKMYFNIGIANRLDDGHLAMTAAKVETYDDDGAPEMTIELPTSVLDLKTRVVTSDSPVKITRSDFELTGDSMIFDTQTRQGRLIGNVRMLIYNLDEMAGEKGENESTKTSDKGAPTEAKP